MFWFVSSVDSVCCNVIHVQEGNEVTGIYICVGTGRWHYVQSTFFCSVSNTHFQIPFARQAFAAQVLQTPYWRLCSDSCICGDLQSAVLVTNNAAQWVWFSKYLNHDKHLLINIFCHAGQLCLSKLSECDFAIYLFYLQIYTPQFITVSNYFQEDEVLHMHKMF